jgi:hypothetical protein
MAKPTEYLDWTDGDAAKVTEPPTGKKLLGWTSAEKPPAQWFNWLFYIADQWIKYFDGEIDKVLASGLVYDAIIGVGGTHNTIPDLMADSDILLKKNILVISPFTLTSTVLIDQNDMKFTFTPKATIAKGSIGLGIHIISERITLEGCRFLNFSGGGEEALKLSSASKYCIIKECRFLNNDTAINDEGTGNNLTANIEEI